MGQARSVWVRVAACGSLAALGACDRSSPTSRAVGEASRSVMAVSVAESSPAPQGVRDTTYAGVADRVRGIPGDAGEGEKSAAMLLSWTAHAALAETPAQAAEDAEGAVRLKLLSIEQALSRWAVANSLAVSAEAFDPSPELDRLARLSGEKDAELARAVARRGELEGRLRDLEKRAAEKLAQSEELQAEYSRLMATTTQMSAAAAAPVVERANRSRVRGEQARLEAGRISAEADLVRPLLQEAAAVVEQLTSQKASLARGAEDLRAQAARAREEAREARASAEAIARDIGVWVGQVEAMRRETLTPAYEKAADLIGRARTAAREAAREPRAAAGRAAAGAASLSAAELHWQRAAGVQAWLSTLQSLARARPALPESERYRAMARAASEERRSALEAATASLDEAIEAFRAVQAPPQVRERLDELTKLLEDARKLANDERLDASSPLAPPAWLGLGSGAGASPAQTLDRLIELSRAGKTVEAMDLVRLPSPGAREKLIPFVDFAAVVQRADRACRDKFAASLAQVAAGGGGAGAMLGPMLGQMGGGGFAGVAGQSLEGLTADDFAWEIGEARATARREGLPMPLTFVKVGEEWKLDIPGLEMMLMQAEMAGAMIAPLRTAVEQWVARVEAGEFADAGAAGKALVEGLGPALQGMMGGMGR
jgi:hypothetical protein